MAEQPALQVESVERIRDIIFGSKMRDYEQRFDALVRDLGRLQTGLDQLAEQVSAKDAAQSKNLQTARQEWRQAGVELRNEVKAETSRVASQLAEHQAAFTNFSNTARQEREVAADNLRVAFKSDIEQVDCAMADQAAAQKAELQSLRTELRKVDTDLRAELRQIMQQIADGNSDRSALGELLVELGNHIKSGDNGADAPQESAQPG